MYYKISGEDLFNLTKKSYRLNAIENYFKYDIVELQEAYGRDVPSDEDIIQIINTDYEQCK